ncbi:MULTISPECIES: DEAD/DEAH box helicase [Paenibacillus]|uniref:DEAD/DEAH box helicase n=1 Tax=Paenibacillus TaxID=44249 RepID=UPI0022B89B7F|nr:DEAD/DEAH box helicase [Paenibacillus caseinilyticus]MCZ8523102.1 DEAD/DEAH box helicase [Paenibacillus caseinilyticus]
MTLLNTLAEVQGEMEADGSWNLWAVSERGVSISLSELRLRLFVWHSRSLYGALLEAGSRSERPDSVRLGPYAALEYLAAPGAALHLPLRWSPQLEAARRVAALGMEALRSGWYQPDAEAWQAGRLDWLLQLPEAQDSEAAAVLEAAGELGLDGRVWFSRALGELLGSDPAVHAAWEGLQQEQPLLQAVDVDAAEALAEASLHMDEEAWLAAAGWKPDEVPFRTGFQLIEPEDEEDDWALRMLLQDKVNPAVVIEVAQGAEGMLLAPEGLPEAWAEHAARRVPQDLERVLRAAPELEEAAGSGRMVTRLGEAEAWAFLHEGSVHLLQAGVSVFLPAWWEELQRLTPRLKAKLKSSVGAGGGSLLGRDQLIQFDWKVAIGDLDFSEEEFARMAAEKKRLLKVRGRWIQLDPAMLRQMQEAMRGTDRRGGLSLREVLEMHLLAGESTDASASDSDIPSDGEGDTPALRLEVELNAHMAQLLQHLQHTKQIPIVEPSAALHAEMRPYQKEGMSWLLFMRRFGLGSCLADDMGLGKTLQFIAYLLTAREQAVRDGRELTPAVLICPTSVLGNWQKELERFAPSMQIYLHYGPQRLQGEAFMEAVRGCDLVLTSYTLAQMDEETLSGVQWDVIGLDEAQNIKNAYTKQSTAVRRLEAGHKIALTGTPVENRLTELWTIFDFINPGYLGSLNEFNHNYVGPIEKTRDEVLLARVQKLIRPFLLRRVKKDPSIQLDLPEKYETKAYVTLTVEQATLYENVVQDLMNRIDTLSGMEKKGLILATLTKLKQICDHPSLFLKDGGGSAADAESEQRSSKMSRLLELVQELRAEGENCLIFTQFVEMGNLLQSTLESELGERVLFLHGGVPKAHRDAMIDLFQRPESSEEERSGVFVLSLKAGGTGLNLTAANHVFHFDRWWNPAVENQATDRAFRIGQTRNVQVHKFIALGTLEERIDEMIERKLGLSQQIVGTGENWVTEMSTHELRELFALRREWVGK